MPQEYHSGGEGNVIIAGTDWNVTNCEFTEDANEQETTTTADFDPTDKFLYKNRQGVKRAADGTFDFMWDKNNAPMPALRSGSIVGPMVVNFPGGHTWNFPLVLIKSTPIRTGGMDGLFSVQCAFGNKGKYTYS